MTTPTLSRPTTAVERRATVAELRVAGDGGPARIVGYAAVFDVLSEPLSDSNARFRERISPGAFAASITRDDVRALVNHDPNHVLGRTRSGTLRLAEDQRGLAVTIMPPATTWADSLLVSMRRGDVDQMSFAFQVIRDQWSEQTDRATGKLSRVRTLEQVRLFDVSIVTFPAYPDTEAQVRSPLMLPAVWTGVYRSPTATMGKCSLEWYERWMSFARLRASAPGAPWRSRRR